MKYKKVLLVIDMQVDFLTGALANPEGAAITEAVAEKVRRARAAGCRVLFTRDTHSAAYLQTQEGRLLPVPHCIEGSAGWALAEPLQALADEADILNKPTFGSLELPAWIEEQAGGVPEEIEVIGVCTDICVISNCMILKAAFPETILRVDGDCCAGVTPEQHRQALAAMAVCQIQVTERA